MCFGPTQLFFSPRYSAYPDKTVRPVSVTALGYFNCM